MDLQSGGTARLLLPVSAERSALPAMIRYAAEIHARGPAVEAVLLHVAPPISQWEVLRFRTQQEVAEFQAERAQRFLDDATTQLAAAGVPSCSLFRRGDVVFTILDVAEEMQCSEIVLPAQARGVWRLLSGGVIRRLVRAQRKIPVREVR